MTEYYLLRFQLDNQDRYLIWVGDDQDHVLLDSTGHILSFPDSDHAHTYMTSMGLKLEDDFAAFYDFDAIQAWINKPDAKAIECDVFLNIWNLVIDVGVSLGMLEWASSANKVEEYVYDMLFYGNNLPSITPARKLYKPVWTPNEIKALQQVFRRGIDMFSKYLRSDD